MKKQIFSVLVLFIMMFTAIGAQADGSPTIDKLYWSDPPIPFIILDRNPAWPDIYSEIIQHYDLSDLNHGDTYTMDEALLITIETRYTRVYWHFASSFLTCVKVNVIFIPTDYSFAKTMSARVIKPDDTLMLSMGTLTPGQYYMIVFGKR